MTNNFFLNEFLVSGNNSFTLSLITIFSIASSIMVITVKNPIVSVLFLISLFANISCYLIIIGLSFIGISYLLVYIGAISILFIFILMLINIRVSELGEESNDSVSLGFIISISFYYPLLLILPNNIENIKYNLNLLINWINYKIYNSYIYMNYLNLKEVNYLTNKHNYLFNETSIFSNSYMWNNSILENTQLSSIGNVIYTSHGIWLIVASIILLLAMVGAIVITIKPFILHYEK